MVQRLLDAGANPNLFNMVSTEALSIPVASVLRTRRSELRPHVSFPERNNAAAYGG